MGLLHFSLNISPSQLLVIYTVNNYFLSSVHKTCFPKQSTAKNEFKKIGKLLRLKNPTKSRISGILFWPIIKKSTWALHTIYSPVSSLLVVLWCCCEFGQHHHSSSSASMLFSACAVFHYQLNRAAHTGVWLRLGPTLCSSRSQEHSVLVQPPNLVEQTELCDIKYQKFIFDIFSFMTHHQPHVHFFYSDSVKCDFWRKTKVVLKNQCTFETLYKEVDIVVKSGKENVFFLYLYLNILITY